MSSRRFWPLLATSALLTLAPLKPLGASVETLTAIGGLPAHLVGQFRDPAAFVETDDGRFIVFDRGAQKIFSVDAAKTAIKRIVDIGPVDGEILSPVSFSLASNRTFAVLDGPASHQRVQTFYDDGTKLGRFRRWPEANKPLIGIDGVFFNGLRTVSSLGKSVLTQLPSSDSLITELNGDGHTVRVIGRPRPTGHERDPELHHALNTGLPLAAPDGGFYFVFTTGVPMFRKYSASGQLEFERHIEGPELDGPLQNLPSAWPTKRLAGREFPVVETTVKTAQVDPAGHLWISLAVPFTYVYGPDGNKNRTVVFRGAGVLSPTSFFFAKNGRLLVTPGCYEFAAR
jgi:hypothetical protein